MTRRDFAVSALAAVASLTVRLPLGRADGVLRNTREVGAALCAGRVLELGIGQAVCAAVIAGNDAVTRYVGCDLDAGSVSLARRLGLDATHGDAVAVLDATEPGAFDWIVCDLDPFLTPDGRSLGAGIGGVPHAARAVARVMGAIGLLVAWGEPGPLFARVQRIRMADLAEAPAEVGVWRVA